MTGAVLLPFGVRKEIRALLPVWLGCATIMAAGAALDSLNAFSVAMIVYAVGTVALGSLSMGHEYTNRTLTLLLSLPVDRRRLYLVKLGVLIPMVAALAMLALVLLSTRRALDPAGAAPILLLAVGCGLFLAPWLTMVCRSPLAGIVFALAIPGVIHVAGEAVGFARYGFGPEAARVRFLVVWWGMTAACAVAVVSSWRMFMRLEAIDGHDAHVRLPRWIRGAAATAPDVARPSHPLWSLARKELRLQQLTFVVSGIYVVEWATLWMLRQSIAGFDGIPIGVLTAFHSGAAALLSGSLASAEERQFGTLESQVLLPMAMWKQWAVKAGMALGLVLALGAGLPALLGSLDPSADSIHVNAAFAGVMVLSAATSLYVSSLCTSGLRALLASVFVLFGIPILLGSVVLPPVIRLLQPLLPRTALVPLSAAAPLAVGLGTGLVALLLVFGLVNHRSSERGLARVWPQAAWIAAWLILSMLLLGL
jgi:hypothetical protein